MSLPDADPMIAASAADASLPNEQPGVMAGAPKHKPIAPQADGLPNAQAHKQDDGRPDVHADVKGDAQGHGLAQEQSAGRADGQSAGRADGQSAVRAHALSEPRGQVDAQTGREPEAPSELQAEPQFESQFESQANARDDEPAQGQGADQDEAQAEKLVPVSEAIRYRKRAQAAEQKLNEVQSQLDDLTQQLAQAESHVDKLERRQRIDQMLAGSDAVDLDVARLLTEAAVADMDEPDVQAAVDELKRTKPYLFRHRRAMTGGMPPRHGPDDSPHDHAAAEAAASGDRRDLLRYLRLRRQHPA